MRYRIKIETFKTGRKKYTPQFRKNFVWWGLGYEGKLVGFDLEYDSRQMALEVIDNHYAGNCKTVNIEFEYITKNN